MSQPGQMAKGSVWPCVPFIIATFVSQALEEEGTQQYYQQ